MYGSKILDIKFHTAPGDGLGTSRRCVTCCPNPVGRFRGELQGRVSRKSFAMRCAPYHHVLGRGVMMLTQCSPNARTLPVLASPMPGLYMLSRLLLTATCW